jgi:hypothetical protein
VDSTTFFGTLNLVSLIYLTAVTALVIGLQEEDDGKRAARHVLGCWGKLLGCLVGIGLIVQIIAFFGN